MSCCMNICWLDDVGSWEGVERLPRGNHAHVNSLRWVLRDSINGGNAYHVELIIFIRRLREVNFRMLRQDSENLILETTQCVTRP